MRFHILAAVPFLMTAVGITPVQADGTLHPNDVSILLQAPYELGDPVLPLPESALPADLAAIAGGVIGAVGVISDPDGHEVRISAAPLVSGRETLYIASLRIDPGAPGLSAGFRPFGTAPQVRLAVQPVREIDGKLRVRDEAVHMVYQFGTPAPTETCPFRVTPDAEAFTAALNELLALKVRLGEMGVETGGPLGVHPAFANQETAAALIEGLGTFVATHLTADRLSAMSLAGLPEDEPEPWIFVALRRDRETGGFKPVPSPAIAQDPANPGFAQMVSISGDAVTPPGLNRNLLAIDCGANFLPPELMAPARTGDGRSTSELFSGAATLADAQAVAEVVNDPARAHFFNTDCVSCHTETRREMDLAGPDAYGEIAGAAKIDPAALPAAPSEDQAFANWNVRAFGWYPGFDPGAPGGVTDGRAHATVVRRTAAETEEVLTCLNSGRWKDSAHPCNDESEARAEPPEPLEQGWSDEVRERFYHTSQGGRLMPLSYFLALQRTDGAGRFAAPANLARYGFLPAGEDTTGLNRHGLPVGFAIDGEGSDAHVGLNCAACHTAEIDFGNGEVRRVDGAPAMLDFDRFIADLSEAVRTTVIMDFSAGKPRPTSRMLAFMGAAGQIDPASADPERIFAFASAFTAGARARAPAHPSGPGRVDALTQIVNAVAMTDLGEPRNLVAPRAPTSYPQIWLAPQLEYVQWNLTVADPLSRNLGQALGVFGTADLGDFTSSARIDALQNYEQWMADLDPPAWPEDLLGSVNVEKAERGRDLFAEHCDGCHNAPPFKETEASDNLRGERFIRVTAIPVGKAGVDPVYTTELALRRVQTQGRPPFDSSASVVPGLKYLGTVVSAVTQTSLAAAGQKADDVLRRRPAGHKDCEGQPPGPSCGYVPPFLGTALKASPLLGVWATGPYLHNGSVRTVYELLSPPESRAKTFLTGGNRLDPKHLGYAETEDGTKFDTTIPGNGNGGHVFWSKPFSEDQKLAIIEYLKDPMRFPLQRAK